MPTDESPRLKVFTYAIFAFVFLLTFWFGAIQPLTQAQEPADPDNAQPSDSVAPADDAVDEESSEAESDDAAQDSGGPKRTGGVPFFELLMTAGWFFMIPIWLVSIGIVTLSIERFIALRRSRVIPDGLVKELGQLGGRQGGFDPRQAYKLCQRFPSCASTVIRAMLLKVGRPHSEVEHAVQEASEREANRLYGNVRWLALAAAVAPLWGLLGTVWGMIIAFHDTAQLDKIAPGQNKADVLAEGIYTALVTTLCGLFIAIPSAILAHYFEGKITKLFHEVDELLFNLLPQIERYEGRVRFNRAAGLDGEDGDDAPPVSQRAAASS